MIDPLEQQEIQHTVKKYSAKHQRIVIKHCLEGGKINRAELTRRGVTPKQLATTLNRLRNDLRDYHGPNE